MNKAVVSLDERGFIVIGVDWNVAEVSEGPLFFPLVDDGQQSEVPDQSPRKEKKSTRC